MGRRWMGFPVAAVVAVVLVLTALVYVTVQRLADTSDPQWQPVALPTFTFTSDLHGNIALIDREADAVSIVATDDPGWGWEGRVEARTLVVHAGDPTQRIEVPRTAGTLAIALPDGSQQTFPLSDGFAARLERDFHRLDDSLLQETLRLYRPGAGSATLERFLSRHDEPPNDWHRAEPTTGPR